MELNIDEYFAFDDFLPNEDTPMLDATMVNRIVGVINNEKKSIEQVEAQRNAEIEYIKGKASEIINSHIARIEYLMGKYSAMIEKFVQNEIEGKKSRSVKMLYGTAGYRKQPASIEIEDAEKALAWAECNMPTAIRIKRDIEKKVIKEYIEQTGEIIEGVIYNNPTDKFYID